ncbi:MAG: GAF domain-containing sensor histidine kinase, partial [Chloroflexota bacterium]
WVTIDGQSPLFVPVLAPLGGVASVLIAVGPVGIVPAVALLILRYRRFGPEQRAQIKWPLFALALAALSTVVLFVEPAPPAIPYWLAAVHYMATFSLLPTGLALGIVTYRGLDIEDVIRRSVIYGALWALIAVLYVGVAAALGIAIGQRVPLALAVVLTIGGTLLFQPARRRLERLADRLVFGPRLTGYQLISRLGERLQSSVPPEDVAGGVAQAVRDGLGASWVSVTLNRPQPTTVASVGVAAAGPPGLVAPLSHDGHVVGLIECGPKLEGRYNEADQHLLNTLGRQAALAIRNAQLSAELQDRLDELAASRARLVQAEDAGRRRLERDLHDGVQQQLVALLARLGLARNQLRRDSVLAEATVRESQIDAQRALEALQELARGIHPAILTDRGLVEAVEERASRMTVPVQVNINGIGRRARFPEEVEGAAYFFVSEALANVLKHASASCVQVRLESKGEQLAIEVQDDGLGFEPAAAGLSGLRGLEDRIEAFGGEMEIVSRPGHGATLRALLPVTDVDHG